MKDTYTITTTDPFTGEYGFGYFVLDSKGLIEGEFENYSEARQRLAELNGETFNGFNVREEYQTKALEEIQEIQRKNSLPYSVAAINISGDLNIGTLLRSAVIFGAERFFIFGKRKYDKRSTVGADNYIDIVHIPFDIDKDPGENVIDVISSYGYNPVSIEQSGNSISDQEHFKFLSRPCLLLGSESQGLPKSILDNSRLVLEIPQVGVMRSLNVASAGSIVMYKAMTEILQR